MPDTGDLPVDESRRYTITVRAKLADLVDQLRSDAIHIDDPRGQALYETSAEVLLGLDKAFADHDARSEPAWREDTTTAD